MAYWCPTLQEADGTYAKKWLVLNVVEAGGRRKEPIGRVVIDLADFAGLDGQAHPVASLKHHAQLCVAACTRRSMRVRHCTHDAARAWVAGRAYAEGTRFRM